MAGDGARIPTKHRVLLVWDSEAPPPDGEWTTALWRDFREASSRRIISIPAFVEQHADEFRSRYLAWVHELGQAVVDGRRVVDWLELRPGFSHWWMTSIAQRFNVSDNSRINDAIKALALEAIVGTGRIERIVLASDDPILATALQQYAGRADVAFEWKSTNGKQRKSSFARRTYAALPTSVRAIFFLSWQIWKRAPRGRAGRVRSALDGRLTFVDTLVHLDPGSLSSLRFTSNYWTLLVEACRSAGITTNWLHNFFAQPAIPSATEAEDLVERFSERAIGIENHALFESDLTLATARRAMRDVRALRVASRRLVDLERRFAPAGSLVNFWPLLEREWTDSLLGHAAISNCLRLSLYEATLSRMPRQDRGVYIQENQAWEMVLLHAWRAGGHGEIIGMPHTTVRFWDLRYFYDPRTYVRSGNDLPRPDLVAVNGPVAKTMYLQGGYPAAEIVEIEAVRYLGLIRAVGHDRHVIRPRSSLSVLVCGEFVDSTTHRMLAWLKVAAQSLPDDTVYVFKPHPAYPVDLSRYKGPRVEVTDAPLAELLPSFDVVFTGDSSSAAADAYCARVPVVQMLDGRGFNSSPLRGLSGVTYVTEPSGLAPALRETTRPPDPKHYFHLDARLPRWRALLGLPLEPAGREARLAASELP